MNQESSNNDYNDYVDALEVELSPLKTAKLTIEAIKRYKRRLFFTISGKKRNLIKNKVASLKYHYNILHSMELLNQPTRTPEQQEYVDEVTTFYKANMLAGVSAKPLTPATLVKTGTRIIVMEKDSNSKELIQNQCDIVDKYLVQHDIKPEKRQWLDYPD